MHVCGERYTKDFLQGDPTILGTYKNKHAQTITFYEHPTKGDTAPIYATIDTQPHLLINTGFYEVDDMVQDHEEYTPAFDKHGYLKFSAEV